MSDVLHHARYTPTQQAAVFHQARFRARIEERAKAITVPLAQPVSVPVPTSSDAVFGPITCPAPVPEPPMPTLQAIIRATCVYFRVSRTDLISQRRDHYLVRARQTAAYLCQTLTPRSLPAIGKQIGNRDHTTILHAVRKIQSYVLFGDQEIITAVDTLIAELAPNQ